MFTFPIVCKECRSKVLYTNKELFEEWNFGDQDNLLPKGVVATKSSYLNCPNCGEPIYVDYASYNNILDFKRAIKNAGKFTNRPELDLEEVTEYMNRDLERF